MEKIIEETNKKIWEENKFQNVSFSFPDTDKVLCANKTILAEVSPVFEAMFFGELAEKRNPIPIVDIEFYIFEAFLKLIYTSKLPLESLEDIQKIFIVANKYGVVAIENYCEKYMIHNIRQLDLESLTHFAEMFSLDNLSQLSRIYRKHNPNPNKKHSWVPWKKGDPLPAGTFFADADTDGWPLAIGRFPGDPKAGTLYIRDMKLRRGWMASVVDRYDNFEILCDGDFTWVPVSNSKRLDVKNRLFIGKILEDGKVYIGDIQRYEERLQIGYDIGSARINKGFFELMDKKIAKSLGEYVDVTLCPPEQNFNLHVTIRQRKETLLDQEKFCDFTFNFENSEKQVKSNKIVLTQISPFFYNMDESVHEIRIQDYGFNVLETFIKYITSHKLIIKSLKDAEEMLSFGGQYEIPNIKRDCECFLMKNLRNFSISEVFDFASKHQMEELKNLSTLMLSNHPRKDQQSNWVHWRRGEFLPPGTYFADFDKDGWPIGIAKFRNDQGFAPGPLYIKTMTAKNGKCAILFENCQEFDILCDGNLEWIESSDGKHVPDSVILSQNHNGIGKTEINGDVVIGKVEPGYFFIPYKSGEACVGKYLHLIDKNKKKRSRAIEIVDPRTKEVIIP